MSLQFLGHFVVPSHPRYLGARELGGMLIN